MSDIKDQSSGLSVGQSQYIALVPVAATTTSLLVTRIPEARRKYMADSYCIWYSH